MISTIEQMLNDMKDGVYDFTKDGKCSQCGQCCGRYLPISEKELKEIKRYVKKHRIKPQRHLMPSVEPTLDLTCPLRNDSERKCMAYNVRPAICKFFRCDNSRKDIQATKREFHAKYRVVDMRKEIFEQ